MTLREPENESENAQRRDFGYEIRREPAENAKSPARFGLARSRSIHSEMVVKEPEHENENAQRRDFGYEIRREPAENTKSPARFGRARSLSCCSEVEA
jgi:hypothetical protein